MMILKFKKWLAVGAMLAAYQPLTGGLAYAQESPPQLDLPAGSKTDREALKALVSKLQAAPASRLEVGLDTLELYLEMRLVGKKIGNLDVQDSRVTLVDYAGIILIEVFYSENDESVPKIDCSSVLKWTALSIVGASGTDATSKHVIDYLDTGGRRLAAFFDTRIISRESASPSPGPESLTILRAMNVGVVIDTGQKKTETCGGWLLNL